MRESRRTLHRARLLLALTNRTPSLVAGTQQGLPGSLSVFFLPFFFFFFLSLFFSF